jgi:threonine dehydratase
MSAAPAIPLDLPTYDDVARAAERIAGVAHRTPVMTSRTADERAGARLFFKCENLQRGGAFKFRGGYNAIACLPEAQRRRGVIAFSSGNHAQAIAYAGKLQGAPTVILMPEDAPAAKIAATRAYGAEVVLFDRYGPEDRESMGRRLAAERGLALLPPFDHKDVIAGQGTAVKELVEETGPLDVIFVCCGGGGLLAGSLLAAEALSPAAKVYGVEPEAGDDVKQSLAAGRRIKIAVPRTLADGAQTTEVGVLTFAIIQRLAAGILTASDDELVSALRFFAERMKLVVEPTGCLAAAAAFRGDADIRGKRVGVILSGGNVDLAALARFFTA